MASVDRLSELGLSLDEPAEVKIDVADTKGGRKSTAGGTAAETTATQAPDIAEHMKLYDPIKAAMEKIKGNIKLLDELKAKDRTIANEKARKEVMDQLDKILNDTNTTGRQIKATLDQINTDNKAYEAKNKDSAKSQMRQNLYQTYIRRFHALMQEYNAESHEFKKNLQERTRRQLKIVDNKISDEEVEKIVESGKANDVIKQALVSENLQDVVADIETRHLEILKLEQQVLQVFELFKDLATLVDLQQESLDVIENRILSAKSHVEKGEQELVEARDYQKKARSKQLYLMLCGLAIVVILLSTVFGAKLVNA